jgi:AcrR family transcriptional regulator
LHLNAIAGAPAAIRYAAYLEALAQEIRKKRTGERSRLKLLAACARLLDTTDFRDLLVEQIAQEAGVAKGTFYIYFKSKDDFLRELGKLYTDFELQTYPRLSSRNSDFTNTRLWVSWYERTFAVNAGVLRCVIQMGASDPQMREIWFVRNSRIVDRAMQGWEKRYPGLDPVLHRWMMRTAGGMLDQSLFERYGVQPGPGLREPEEFDTLVELHALLNFRAMHGRNPPLEEFAPDSPSRRLIEGGSTHLT